MWSVKSALPFVVSALTFAASAAPAEAKIIQYEINGQVYSLRLFQASRAQIEAARLRINAANRAGELREQARTERESNFIVRFSAPPRRQRLLRPKPSFSAFLQCPQLPRSGSGLSMPRSPLSQDLGRERELQRGSGPRLSRLKRRDGLPLRGS